MCDAPCPESNEGGIKKRPLQEESENTDSKKQCIEPDRVRRRKVALLLAYSGQGYLGMQRLVLVTSITIGCYNREFFVQPHFLSLFPAACMPETLALSAKKKELSVLVNMPCVINIYMHF
jgi:hypothetical protein